LRAKKGGLPIRILQVPPATKGLIELHDDRAPVEFSESESIFCAVKLQLSVENGLDQKGPERIAIASLS